MLTRNCCFSIHFGHIFATVLQFLVEMDYRVAAAMHNRHKCHRLAGIEVLVCIIGSRAEVPSTYKWVYFCVYILVHFFLFISVVSSSYPY